MPHGTDLAQIPLFRPRRHADRLDAGHRARRAVRPAPFRNRRAGPRRAQTVPRSPAARLLHGVLRHEPGGGRPGGGRLARIFRPAGHVRERTLSRHSGAARRHVIATSKPQPFAERIAAHFGIDRHFRLISGSTFDGRRKTKADVIRHALSALGIAPDEAVMIGDRRHDVEGAAEEGLPAIAVEWGYAPPGELEAARPLRIVPDVETLRRLLLGNE